MCKQCFLTKCYSIKITVFKTGDKTEIDFDNKILTFSNKVSLLNEGFIKQLLKIIKSVTLKVTNQPKVGHRMSLHT